MEARPIEFEWRGKAIAVSRGTTYPKTNIFITIDGKEYFLGHVTRGMSRGDVKRAAIAWLIDRAKAKARRHT